MKRPHILLLALMAFCLTGMAQNKSEPDKVNDKGNIYTSLKPADGTPAVFSTREELDAKVQDKKNRILDQIKTNADQPEKVKALREQLWRFENAIVQTTGTK